MNRVTNVDNNRRTGICDRTVYDCHDKNRAHTQLLGEVDNVWDLWGVGIVRPGLPQGIGHGADECSLRKGLWWKEDP